MTKSASHPNSIDLLAIARQTMIDAAFKPDFSGEVKQEVKELETKTFPSGGPSARDLRKLLWSSIDDTKSRDLDQVEFAETLDGGDTRLLIGVADVDAYVSRGSAIDGRASENGTSVYTGVRTYPMLPEELSTGLTSLNPGEDRLAVVTELVLAPDGTVHSQDIYGALVHNYAKLSYESVGAWLDGKSNVPATVEAVPGLEAQLRLQFESSKDLRELRKQHGSLELGMIQASPVIDEHGKVTELEVVEQNGARDLIANFMIAANVAMAQFLEARGGPTLRRVVRTPKYWSRIVEIAAELGDKLPANPDSRSLADFLARRRAADPIHFPDLSLAVVKSLGPGEYAVQLPGEAGGGHFGLAVQDYTHSTAPNRRFADLVTQRLVKAALDGKSVPYTVEELKQIAAHCTERDEMARKVERKMRKVASAVLLSNKIGQEFNSIITGVTEKGTFARLVSPPVDGRVMRGEHGLRVGDKVRVRLVATEPERGFIDFARV
jgi:exoribonuclease-2